MSKPSSAAGELPTSREEGLPQRKVLLSPKLWEPGVWPRFAVSRGIAETGRHEEFRVKLAELPRCPKQWGVWGGQGRGQHWERISLACL